MRASIFGVSQMNRHLSWAMLLCAILARDVAAQQTKPGRPDANKSLETVMLSANLTFSVINGVYLTQGSGSAWAAPLGMISGVGSLLYESGVNEGNGFVVATGFVSVAFGIVSLVKVESRGKAKPEAGLNFAPVTARDSDGRWYGGVAARLRF
jgi:hypothetical protein